MTADAWRGLLKVLMYSPTGSRKEMLAGSERQSGEKESNEKEDNELYTDLVLFVLICHLLVINESVTNQWTDLCAVLPRWSGWRAAWWSRRPTAQAPLCLDKTQRRIQTDTFISSIIISLIFDARDVKLILQGGLRTAHRSNVGQTVKRQSTKFNYTFRKRKKGQFLQYVSASYVMKMK